MQAFKLLLCAPLLLLPATLFAEDVTVSIPINGANPPPLIIATNQVAELISSDARVYFSLPISPNLSLLMDIPGFQIAGQPWISHGARMVVGPATITVMGNELAPCHATFRITPQAFEPEKTAIIPQLSNGATVALQQSTNLVNWVNTTNGIYSGTNGAVFFRVNLERAP